MLCQSCGKEITELENAAFNGFCSECSVGYPVDFVAIGKDSTKDLVTKLNNLIETCVCNGADIGGSYDQCLDQLKESIEDMLVFLNIDCKCDIEYTKHHGCYSPYKINLKE